MRKCRILARKSKARKMRINLWNIEMQKIEEYVFPVWFIVVIKNEIIIHRATGRRSHASYEDSETSSLEWNVQREGGIERCECMNKERISELAIRPCGNQRATSHSTSWNDKRNVATCACEKESSVRSSFPKWTTPIDKLIFGPILLAKFSLLFFHPANFSS